MIDLVSALAILERARHEPEFAQRFPLACKRALYTVIAHTDEVASKLNDPNLPEAW